MSEPFYITTNQPTLPVQDGEQSSFTWIIEPLKNPDQYYLARTSKEKTLTFQTEQGPRTLQILPNRTYPIVFEYGDTIARAEVISRDDHSAFMNPTVAISIFVIATALGLASKKMLHKIQTKYLLHLGLGIPVLFWFVFIVGGFVHGGYSHVSDVVSELGALGTKSEVLMSVSELCLAGLVILFFIGLRRELKSTRRSIIPVIPVLFLGFALIGVAFFPLNNYLHPLVGNLSLPLFFAPIISLIAWRKSDLTKHYLLLTRISIFVTLCFGLRFIPNINQEFEGVIQRIFYLGWNIWFVALWFLFNRPAKPEL